MKVSEIADACGWSLLTPDADVQNEAGGCYIGDLLSWVMARASEGDIWLTVMGNVNAVAVASLTGVACIVLTEGAALDDEAKQRAIQQDIPIFSCEEKTYETAVAIRDLLAK